MARLVVVSFRLGGTDGVSVEAAKWMGAFRRLGHQVTTVAGEGGDVVIAELAIGATTSPRHDELGAALADADVVVVENLASLPLNPGARDVLYDVLEGRRALFRHHDLAWQRERFRDERAPRDAPTWRHVTINDLSRLELKTRGVTAVTVPNAFDCQPPLGRRSVARRSLDVGDARLVLMPSRAIARKNVAGAVTLASALKAILWILGPSEDGYEDTLANLLCGAEDVRRGLPAGLSVHDAYAASDLVVVPSTWEGFGNPVLESVTHRRPLAVYPYPVLEEIRSHGFRFFTLDDVAGLDDYLRAPDADLLEHNLELARRHFNLLDLPARLATILASLGVTTDY